MYIILILFVTVYSFQNKTKLKLHDKKIMGIINAKDKVKIILTGTHPFETKLYTTSGIPLYFKGRRVSYTGHPTFYEIQNIDIDIPNKITLEIYEIETDWAKICTTILSICTIFILVIYKRDHVISQICLVTLLIIEMIRGSDYSKVADRIFHKILF
jgi:hypothetical protein